MHFREEKPRIIAFPNVPKSDCRCSFCILVLGLVKSNDLTANDRKIYQRHLKKEHGLVGEIPA